MIGAIIGDIAGSRFEFHNARNDKFQLFTKECDFTDDTICTVAVADAIMHGRRFADALRDWGNRYPHPKGGYGAAFGAWLDDPAAGPYWSWGNGAAMRVSAIPMLTGDFDTCLHLAAESARVSHDHPYGIKGAVVTAGAEFVLYEHMAKGESIEEAKAAFAEYVSKSYQIPAFKPYSNPFKETCMNAVPVAAACLLASTGFEDAIRKAIVVGGDSDTIAAICGGWAEALYGVPEHLAEKAMAYLPDDIRGVVEEYYDGLGE
jgi:ADP-ribosylglycohydrolase